jgi:hypothetical protein
MAPSTCRIEVATARYEDGTLGATPVTSAQA